MDEFEGPDAAANMFKSFTKTYHHKPYPQISPSRPELKATEKVIFITGGGSGIGKATAIAFARAGAKAIAIFGRRIERLKTAVHDIRTASNGQVAVVCESVDLTERVAVDAAFSNALKQLGEDKVDVFINNAGMLPEGKVGGFPEKQLYEFVSLIIGTSFNSVQAILPLLAPKPKIFNMSSCIVHTEMIPDVWLYSALKAATTKMFDYLQVENPELHVVNVHPGIVATDINPRIKVGQDEVELPAHFHVWLASPEAEFLKGKFVWVNWNVDEMKARADEIKNSVLLKVVLNGVAM